MYFNWELHFVHTFLKCSFIWFQPSVVKRSLGKTLSSFDPWRSHGSMIRRANTGLENLLGIRSESCRSPNTTTPFNFLGTQASAKVFKGNNSNQTWFTSPAGRVKKGHKALDLFSHPEQEQDSPKHFSPWSCVKNRAGCVLKTDFTDRFQQWQHS